MIKAGAPLPTPLPERLSNRTLNTLARNGITTAEQVADAYPIRLLKIPGFGLTALREVEMALFPWQQYTPTRRKRGRQPKHSTGRAPDGGQQTSS
ncbi:DNA-directed RNA polymerase alpha subunit [Comamonas odontotermitis]|uniref:DNA-directed RNA polymerase alpha subunit n=1 Tax=Comamonas odontotermitis TaxID=379895 RepID=A0ABR6RGQ3_9BURK|nr:DNA-directed RNA polymerase subunit alpha C-terminal domain-containing protein [Comamonas odontotermitis]MBB6578337.1 DNA-directed RNA polymerase alpha subunit [Comamonas odontotermitis]